MRTHFTIDASRRPPLPPNTWAARVIAPILERPCPEHRVKPGQPCGNDSAWGEFVCGSRAGWTPKGGTSS